MKTGTCILAALLAVAGTAQANDSLTPMQEGPVREATEALRSAQAAEALAHTAENLKSQNKAGLIPEHDDHGAEVLWLMSYVPLGTSPQGFYSFENAEDYAQTASILLVGDSGQLLRGAEISVPGDRLTHINSQDLLKGNPEKSVTVTVVAEPQESEAAWALVTTPANMWVRAYVRAPGGFVSGMSDTLERYISGTGLAIEHATFFNPGSNQGIVSVLRILNSATRPRTAVIDGKDAHNNWFGPVTCRMEGGQALMLSARALEEGPDECSGRLGDGAGKWRLFVSSDDPDDTWFTSMSQLWGTSGIVTNVSFPEPFHFTTQ